MKNTYIKNILISVVIVGVIGLIIGYVIDKESIKNNEDYKKITIKTEKKTIKDIDNEIFNNKTDEIIVYKDGKRIDIYKNDESTDIMMILNKVYEEIYDNEKVNKFNNQYNTRFEFDKKIIFYMNTNNEKNVAFEKNGEIRETVLNNKQYSALRKYAVGKGKN